MEHKTVCYDGLHIMSPLIGNDDIKVLNFLQQSNPPGPDTAENMAVF